MLISFKDGAVLYSIAERDASYKGVRSCYQVTTASGRSTSCTEGHLLPTNNGKMRLSEIVEYMYGTDEAGLRKIELYRVVEQENINMLQWNHRRKQHEYVFTSTSCYKSTHAANRRRK